MSTIYNHPGRHWFKSSFSRDSTSCVQVSLSWAEEADLRDATSCVDVDRNADTVLIRDDKFSGDPAIQPTIGIPAGRWETFLTCVLDGTTTNETADGIPAIIRETDGTVTLRDSLDQELVFTPSEWDAFIRGIEDGEFTMAPALTSA